MSRKMIECLNEMQLQESGNRIILYVTDTDVTQHSLG